MLNQIKFLGAVCCVIGTTAYFWCRRKTLDRDQDATPSEKVRLYIGPCNTPTGKLMSGSDHIDEKMFLAVKQGLIDAKKYYNSQPDLELHLCTVGGELFYCRRIVQLLHKWKGRKTAFIQSYSCSGGSLIALACDEIVMTSESFLTPFDPQFNNSKTHISGVHTIEAQDIDINLLFETDRRFSVVDGHKVQNVDSVMLAAQTKKFVAHLQDYFDFCVRYLACYMSDDQKRAMIKLFLTSGHHLHEFYFDQLQSFGLNVRLVDEITF